MNKYKAIFWISTGTVSVMMLFSAFSYITADAVKNGFIHLGFPSYFRVELAVAKTLGAIALLLPLSSRLKEIPYIGFAITFISAFIAHLSSGDPVPVAIMPVIFLGLLVVSYIYFHKTQSVQSK